VVAATKDPFWLNHSKKAEENRRIKRGV